MKYTIYQAGPLFSEAEQNFHRMMKAELEKAGHTVIWPGELMTAEEIRAQGESAAQQKFILNTNKAAIADRCNCMVALLDGTQVDDGTAWEVGYAFGRREALKINYPIFGIRTDFRQAGEPGALCNAMIEAALDGYARNIPDLVRLIESHK